LAADAVFKNDWASGRRLGDILATMETIEWSHGGTDIRVEIILDEALSNVVAEGFNAGIRLGHALERDMVAVRLNADQQIVVVGSPEYFASHGKPWHPRDLHVHDCINLRKTTRGTVVRWRFVENGKDLDIAVEGQIVTNDGAVLVDAAADGLGLAYVFERMVRQALAEKRLVRVLDRYCPQIQGYFLYYPSRVNVAPKLRALVDFLKRRGSGRGPTHGAGVSRTQGRA
jgi:DNA-binding transcriptional LysR family regulator